MHFKSQAWILKVSRFIFFFSTIIGLLPQTVYLYRGASQSLVDSGQALGHWEKGQVVQWTNLIRPNYLHFVVTFCTEMLECMHVFLNLSQNGEKRYDVVNEHKMICQRALMELVPIIKIQTLGLFCVTDQVWN